MNREVDKLGDLEGLDATATPRSEATLRCDVMTSSTHDGRSSKDDPC